MSRDKTESRQSTKMLRLSFNVRCMEVDDHKIDYKVRDNWNPSKNDEKCFLFHLKNSFRSQDI